MNEQNLNNVIVIDRVSKKILNEPNIEIDEEVYAEAVSRLVDKLLVSLRQKRDLKKINTKECVFTSKARQQKNFATINLQTNLFTALTVKYPKTVI